MSFKFGETGEVKVFSPEQFSGLSEKERAMAGAQFKLLYQLEDAIKAASKNWDYSLPFAVQLLASTLTNMCARYIATALSFCATPTAEKAMREQILEGLNKGIDIYLCEQKKK